MTIFLDFFLFTFISAIPVESDSQQNVRHVANNNFEETTKSSFKSRKVANSPVDLNPLNFRNAPKDVASKEDWNRISQLLEDGRGTHPAAHPYLRNGQNDWKLVRPVLRYVISQNEGELEKLMSEVNNPSAHRQFEVPGGHLFQTILSKLLYLCSHFQKLENWPMWYPKNYLHPSAKKFIKI
jgi:hypothetical protein